MPSKTLETSYSPRRRRRTFAVLAALSALFAVAGIVAWAMLPPLDRGDDASPAQTPHDLVTDGLGGPIAIETQAPTTTADGRTAAVVHAEPRDDDDPAPTPRATSTPGPAASPFFACDTWSTVIQPGGVQRIGCHMYPASYPGTVDIVCVDDPSGGGCTVEPGRLDLRGTWGPIPFDVVLTTPYGTQPSTYSERVRMVGGPGQQRTLKVVVPPVVGTVAIECPAVVTVAIVGDQTITCEVTSQDGFDGNVRIAGSSIFEGGGAQLLTADPVRVPLDETVAVELTLRSTALPLLPVLMELDVHPDEYVSETFSFLLAPLT